MSNITLQEWDQATFLSNEREWQKLLVQGNADQLFLSWYWLKNWWHRWGGTNGDRILILAVYDDRELIGLAPFYLSNYFYINNLIRSKRLQFLGKRFKGSGGIRSEYMDIITIRKWEKLVSLTVAKHLLSTKIWDELIISDINDNSIFYKTLLKESQRQKIATRKLSSDSCYSIDTTGTFDNYLSKLGKSTRLKLYNRRKTLSKYGEISLETACLESNDDIFDILNSFHKLRYNSPAFDTKAITMIAEINDKLPMKSNEKAFSSILKVNNQPISVIVNLYITNKIYNIQLGYFENFDKRISLGLLHLGYSIEMAFSSNKVETFDLLAGKGKTTNYKERIADCHTSLVSKQFVRRPVLELIYFTNDFIKSLVRKVVSAKESVYRAIFQSLS